MLQQSPLLKRLYAVPHPTTLVEGYKPLVFFKNDIPLFSFCHSKALSGNNLNTDGNVLYFVTEGILKLTTRGKAIYLKANDMILLPKDQVFAYKKKVDPCSGQFCAMIFHIHNPQIFALYARFNIERYNHVLPYVPTVYSVCAENQRILKDLQDDFFNKQGILSECLQNRQDEILFYIIESYPDLFQSIFQIASKNNDDMMNRIEQYCQEGLSTKETARKCGLTNRQLNSIIIAVHHSSSSKWFRTKNLERAKILLTKDKLSPQEVFSLVGFNDLKYFCKVYKKKYGITPRNAKYYTS